jgi:hypothetical protein
MIKIVYFYHKITINTPQQLKHHAQVTCIAKVHHSHSLHGCRWVNKQQETEEKKSTTGQQHARRTQGDLFLL